MKHSDSWLVITALWLLLNWILLSLIVLSFFFLINQFKVFFSYFFIVPYWSLLFCISIFGDFFEYISINDLDIILIGRSFVYINLIPSYISFSSCGLWGMIILQCMNAFKKKHCRKRYIAYPPSTNTFMWSFML